jgi:hypothetical protein
MRGLFVFRSCVCADLDRGTNSHVPHWRRTVKVFTRTAALAVGLLASPVALIAQTAAAGARIDSVATQTAGNTTSINFVWTLVAG